MTTPPTLTEFEAKLAQSLREAPAQPTPACYDEETLWEFAEQGGKHLDALNLIRHISSCAYCTQGYFAMQEMRQLRGLLPASEESEVAAEAGSEGHVPTWWERLQAFMRTPQVRFRFQLGGMGLAGAGAAAMLLLFWPRLTPNHAVAAPDAALTRRLQQSEQNVQSLKAELTRQQQQAQAELQTAHRELTQQKRELAQKKEAELSAQQLLVSARDRESRLNAQVQSLSARVSVITARQKSFEQIASAEKGNRFNGIAVDAPERRSLRTGHLDFPSLLASLAKTSGQTMGGGGEEPIALYRPQGTFVASLRPAFAWKAVPLAAKYRLTCIPQNQNQDDAPPPYIIPAKANASKPEFVWTIPTDAPALQPATTYTWTVQALDADENHLAGSSKQEELFFRTLTPAELDEIQRKRRKYADNPLSMGALYARLGVLEEAEQAFARYLRINPQNTTVRRMLKQVQAQQKPRP